MTTQERTPDNQDATVDAAPERQSTPFLVLQFFIFPMAIVAVCVSVFLVFGLISSERKSPRAYLDEVRHGGGLFNVKRWQAAFALANALENEKDLATKDPRFAEELVRLFEDTQKDDPLVRRYLALALGRLGDHRTVPCLRKLLETAGPESDAETLIYAAWALGTIGDPSAIPELTSLAAHEDPGLRKAAVHALGGFATAEAQAILRNALADGTNDVRWNAAVALGRHGDPTAAPVLLVMMDRRRLASVPGTTPQQQDEAVLQAVGAAAAVPDPGLRAALVRLHSEDASLKVREAARAALDAQRP